MKKPVSGYPQCPDCSLTIPFPSEKTRTLGEMTDSRSVAENVQDE